MKRIVWLSVLALGLALITGPFFTAQATSFEELEQQVMTLQKELQDLRVQNATSRESLEKRIDKAGRYLMLQGGAAGAEVGYKDGFFINATDNQWGVKIKGRVNTDYRYYEGGTGAPQRAFDYTDVGDDMDETGSGLSDLDSGFVMRRVRLAATGHFLNKLYTFKVQGDFTDKPALEDGWLNFNPCQQFNVRAGQFKVPLGKEEMMSSLVNDFIERSAVVDSLAPGRDAGAMIHGKLGENSLRYYLGIWNGSGQNTPDNNDDVDGAARLEYTYQDAENERWLIVGSSVTHGQQGPHDPMDAATPSLIAFGPVTPLPRGSAKGERTRFGADAALQCGPFGLKSEYIYAQEELNGSTSLAATSGHSLRAEGWFVSATYMLTGEHKPTNWKVQPDENFDPRPGSGWGAFELAARVGELAINGLGVDKNRARTFTAGLNWYMHRNVRAQVNYVLSHFGHRGNITDGGPAAGESEIHAILARWQVWF